MRKSSIFSILLALVLVLLVPMQTNAATGAATKLKVIQSVSFRTQPSTSGTFIRYLKTSEIVTAVAMPNPSWYQIQDQQGVSGYVSSNQSYITVLSNAKVILSTAFKSQASSSSTTIRTLPAGEELDVVKKFNDYWYQAKDASGSYGYVTTSSSYLSTNFTVTGVILPLAERIESVINAGMKYLGTPYEYGSTRFNTATFDCSDFTQQAFWDGSRTVIPSDSDSQADYVKNLHGLTSSLSQLKRGDLIFFMSYKGSTAGSYSGVDKTTEPVTHVGIYLGNGQVLHTFSVASGGVQVTNIVGTAWEYRMLYGGSAF